MSIKIEIETLDGTHRYQNIKDYAVDELFVWVSWEEEGAKHFRWIPTKDVKFIRAIQFPSTVH